MWFSHASSATTWHNIQSTNVLHHLNICTQFNKMRSWSHFIRPAVSILQLDVGLFPDAVQVLMETIKEEGQEFMRVLLLVARELRSKAAHLGLGQEDTVEEKLNQSDTKKYRKKNYETCSVV